MLSERQTADLMLEYEDSRFIKVYKHLGKDVQISSLAEIKRPHLIKIGNHSAIGSFTEITTAADIGDYCHISYSVSVIGGEEALLVMDHFSHLAAGVRLICSGDEHRGAGLVSPLIPKQYRDKTVGGVIHIGRYVSVLSNAVVEPGLTLAEGSMVGAGAVLRQNTEPWTVYVGAPARPVKLRPSEKMIQFAKEMGY